MKKLKKIIIIYVIGLAVGGITATAYHNSIIENGIITNVVIGFESERIVNVDQKKIFDVIADMKSYPQILEGNYISIIIINQTIQDLGVTKIFAEEKVSEAGVILTFFTEHSIRPYDFHKIEILEGDAKGTIIQVNFRDTDDGTKINTEVILRLKGLLAPFGQLTKNNLESAFDTMLDRFEEYAINH